MKKKAWYEYLESIDRRLIFLAVFLCLLLPYIFPFKLRLPIDPGVDKMFKSIEKLAEENQERVEEGKSKKIALIVVDWEASTKAECWPQTLAIMAHLYTRKIPFAMMSFYPEGPRFAKLCIEDLFKQKEQPSLVEDETIDYSKISYGVDYCNWGFTLPEIAVYRAMSRDLYSIVEADTRGTPIREVLMMSNIESMHDIGFVFHCSGAAMIANWMQYIQPDIGFDLGAGVTGIMGPEFSPYLDSGQITGLLIGMSGAYQYEELMLIEGLATKGMGGQSVAHLWIILAMILGNIGFIFLKRAKAREEQMGL